MSAGQGGDRFRELEQAYNEYTVYDQHYEKVGKIDDIFVDANDQPEYIGVKTGLLGMKSTLIPIDLIRVNDRRKLVEVAADGEAIKNAPTFDNDGDITPEYEDQVHGYFGQERPSHMQGSGGYGGYYDSPVEASRDEELSGSVDTEYGERTGASAGSSVPSTEPASTSGGNLDVPLGGREPETQPPREEPAASSTTDPLDADAATREGGARREEIEVQEDSNVRVYKRAARPSR
ncbi:MAG: PRC-barrel domain-containing protein [Rubrobacter sp.]|nr:PRC-barrel domain-containing protein [Rubrobacter sp.]